MKNTKTTKFHKNVELHLVLYLLISTLKHTLLLFAALFESLFNAINGLCLTDQPVVV